MSHEAFQAPSLEYLGEHLPQYAFESFIAQGGMGAVYKASQLSLDRDVAIKVLPHELGEDEEFRESFAKEAKAMARLNHPNLIGVFDSGTVDGMPYIVMEYIEGSSLHDACHLQKLESAQAVAIVKGICLGLADAHEHGIIHRDIKPANILLTSRAEPKIGDFGLAHPSDSEESGLVMGTPGYTAPEIFIDPDQAGVLADQYSVGMILHQLLTGTDPAGTEGPPTLASGNIRLDAIWRRATQLNPEERYPSMEAMAEELGKWENVKTGTPVTGAGLGAPVPSINPTMLSSKKSGGGILFKMVAVVALLAGLWFVLQKLQDSNNPISQGDGNPEQPGTPESPDPTTPKPPTPKPPAPRPDRPQNPGTKDPGGKQRPEVVSRPETPSRPDPVIPDPVIPDVPAPAPKPPRKPEIPPGDPDLRAKAATLIADARKKRNALLSKNSLAFIRILDGEIATASSSVAKRYQEVRRECQDGWVPEPAEMPEMNLAVSRAYTTVHKEQTSIDAKYLTEITRIRDYYVSNLEKAANATSDPELKKRLEAQASRATVVKKWADLLAPEDEQAAISLDVPAVTGGQNNAPAGGGGFVGTWDVVSDKTSKWETRADGTLTVIGPGWQGNWKILGDGSLQINFDGKKPYQLTRNGNGWSGRTGYDRPIRITPANGARITEPDRNAHRGGFAGRWEVHSDNFTIYDCRPDGTFVVEGRNWTGTWEEQRDGTIKVQMQQKKPHFIKRQSDGSWEAPNGRNRVIRFVSVNSKHAITNLKAGTASGERHARDFVGKWESHTNTLMRWEADSSGTITISDTDGNTKNWTGVWKALPNGNIWIQIATKSPHEFERSGRGWTNIKQKNHTLSPGRW